MVYVEVLQNIHVLTVLTQEQLKKLDFLEKLQCEHQGNPNHAKEWKKKMGLKYHIFELWPKQISKGVKVIIILKMVYQKSAPRCTTVTHGTPLPKI